MKSDRLAEPTLFETFAGIDSPSGGEAQSSNDSVRRAAGPKRGLGVRSAVQGGAPLRSARPVVTRTDPSNGSGDPSSDTLAMEASASAVPHLLDITALAEHLGVTPRHVRRLVAERRVPFVRWGHLIRFDPDEIVTWLEQARVPGAPVRESGLLR